MDPLTHAQGPTEVTHAAGAIVWRGDPNAPQIAVIHRPRYDDWSFPKGKQDDAEPLMATALREIREEIGAVVRLGPPLPLQRYRTEDGFKEVSYWSAQCLEQDFVASDEVDEVRWLDPALARSLVTRPSDAALVDGFVALPRPTFAAIALRHAKAVPRSRWHHPDDERPLTPRGHLQAEALAELLLAAYGTVRLMTSPWRRCVQTVEPYAKQSAAGIEFLDSLGEDEFEECPELAIADVARLSALPESTLFCSHGNVMPAITAALSGHAIGDPELSDELLEAPLAKGEFVVIHRSITGAPGGAPPAVVAVERHHPTELLRVHSQFDHDA